MSSFDYLRPVTHIDHGKELPDLLWVVDNPVVVEGQLVTDIAGVLLGRTLSRAEVVASVAGFVI